MREVEYLRTAPEWKRNEVASELVEARAKAAQARKQITQIKRHYGIQKPGYNIDVWEIQRAVRDAKDSPAP